MAKATSLSNLGILNAYDTVAASTTDSELVTAVTGRKIRVRSVVINQGDTTPSSVQFNSDDGDTSTAISPAFKAAANGGFVMNDNPQGWFETESGEALTVTTGSGSNTAILVTYDRVPVPR